MPRQTIGFVCAATIAAMVHLGTAQAAPLSTAAGLASGADKGLVETVQYWGHHHHHHGWGHRHHHHHHGWGWRPRHHHHWGHHHHHHHGWGHHHHH